KLLGGVSALGQQMGIAGQVFAYRADCILLVELTYFDDETKDAVKITGQLVEDLVETVPTLEAGAQAYRTANGTKTVQHIADDELVVLAQHGLKRDACIRQLVLDSLVRKTWGGGTVHRQSKYNYYTKRRLGLCDIGGRIQK
ncbi:hypothetical protein V8E36_008184, partial [Tilletia maclaganii]